ncbi:MAG: hypothetical protein KatS3mg108_2552 [Isosphaeraceae bacterium]|jgi:hypothetical protein|nr:MAG: hypothetical protein KatS3mg108_2552 [Isosphaeraceae bacterium]
MEYIQLCIVLAALYLFLAQPFLIAWGVIVDRWSPEEPEVQVREDPDSVDAIPVVDLDEITSAWTRGKQVVKLGRNRFRREVYKITDRDGRVGYYYWDMATHERLRTGKTRRPGAASAQTQQSGPLLGWKGFDATSSPWEVLGVARDASIAQIKSAYRVLIAKYHPDRFAHLSAPEIEQLKRDSQLVNAAYAKLVKPS